MSILDKIRGLVASSPKDEPAALTAGVQDHTDPWVFAGEDADAPTDPEEVDER